MKNKEQISEIHDIISGVLIGTIKSYDAAIKIQELVKKSDSLPPVMISSLPDEDSIREYALDWGEKFSNETGDEETMRSIAYTSYRRGCQKVNRILSNES
jgi:hypothetical protein